MNSLSPVSPAVCILAALLVSAGVPSAFGSGEPQESYLYKNFAKASEVLDRAVAAHGGTELLDRALNVRFSFTGTYRAEGHYARPWAHRDYRLEGTTFYSADRRAMKQEVTFYEEEGPVPSFIMVGPTNGLRLNGGGSQPDSIPEKELEKSLRDELEVLPHEYLRQARAGAAGLRLLSGPKGYDVVTYTLDNGEGRALFFDARTHLLMRVERIDHWKHKGDRLEWRTFTDYVDRGGIRVPLYSELHIEDSSTQHNVISEIAKIEFGAAVSADEFTMPAAYRAGFEGWTLEEPKAVSPDELLPSHDLGEGVFIIDLPPSTARSLLVAFSDFSVIVEAGDYSEISARVLATADHLLPDKPVRYVAMTHHHPLYANGLRPYAQRGITILTTKGNVEYLRDLTTRPYRIRPDAQQHQPRAPKFEVIDGTKVITDGKQRLELYEFDYSTHTDEYVLPYLSSHKLIVTGDMVYILRDAPLGPARPRELAIHRVVTERGLNVESIMQTWFLAETDQLVPYSVLEEKVRLAEAKDSKK
jgi:glyoxylase-like metal-dependent hydrolase (beta-lactamase superfamily II)